jgi:hypothetical protein
MNKSILLIMLLGVTTANAQWGGKYTYSFLNFTPSARVAALGGNNIAVKDGDLSSALLNPASLSSEMKNHLVLGYYNHFNGINYGMTNYGFQIKNYGSFSAGINFANYGKFTLADETSAIQGEFKAADYCFNLGWGKMLDSNFSMGVNVKTVYSQYYTYTSTAVAMDMAAMYNNDKLMLTATALIKNAGMQLKTYADNREKLPTEFQAGISKGLKHVPLRFHLTGTNLQQWNMSYTDSANIQPTVDPVTGARIKEKNHFIDNLGKHLVVGAELNPAKSFSLRFAYNYRLRQEMRNIERVGVTGFSFGFGIKIKMFRLDYGRTQYHASSASHLFTLTLSFNNLFRGQSTGPAIN